MQNMPLLLFDLDNTLLPRDAAFRAWAHDFLTELGLPPAELDWLATIDGGGYVPRSTVLSAARRRYGLDHSLDYLLAHYRRGINSHIHCPTRHVDALRAARAAGWTLGIVSNGGTRPQLEKIRNTGLGPLVDGWVISEEAQCLKPDPLIFEIAAHRCGVAPTGDWASDTWMVGDHAPADIAGAELAGLRSVWLHHGRPWSEPGYRPTLSARGLPEAVGLILSAADAPSARAGGRPVGRPGAGPRTSAAARTAVDPALTPLAKELEAPNAPSAPGPATVRNRPAAATGVAAGTSRTPRSEAAAGARPRPRTRFAVPIAHPTTSSGTTPAAVVAALPVLGPPMPVVLTGSSTVGPSSGGAAPVPAASGNSIGAASPVGAVGAVGSVGPGGPGGPDGSTDSVGSATSAPTPVGSPTVSPVPRPPRSARAAGRHADVGPRLFEPSVGYASGAAG
ncbi:HAD-IA family hydrolase [Kitasatospora sp. NBC_00240]|uniref:HAD-IA family hydrolase n=1 Tax=Kitasatospora sp. NBC_00240 TaxID=2903567 RepID=UPI00225A3DDC|nr:HAD-IA family hydrolase [Kitasatospora sp. NBC_00240]MCX5212798.1 HAD-IA family hydrolase [Kitasatospora sp. NBC_00240]